MTENLSKISIDVIMSCFNCESTVLNAIRSILNTELNIRLLIVDDCSNDSTFKLISSLNDSRIKCYKNSKNLGLSKSLNMLISKSDAKYIARMDADDVVVNSRFEKQFQFLESNKKVDVCGTFALGYYNSGKKVMLKRPLLHIDLLQKIHIQSPFIHPTVMARAHFFKNNKYNPNFRRAQDWELFSRKINSYKYQNLPFAGIEYAISSGLSYKSIPIRYCAALLASYRSNHFFYGLLINTIDIFKTSIGIFLRNFK